jgi:KDO2-lipid IV(A) lauroyltransferase
MPAGPALLALRTEAPLYAVDIRYTPERPVCEIRRIELPDPGAGPLDVRVKLVTQRLADAYAIGIADHPQDWHMLQKLWI